MAVSRDVYRVYGNRGAMRGIGLVLLLLSGCVNASLSCPSGKSTVSYRGLALFGTTSVSCIASLTGGDIAQVSGVDLGALAAMVAPMVLAQPLPKAEPKEQDNSWNL